MLRNSIGKLPVITLQNVIGPIIRVSEVISKALSVRHELNMKSLFGLIVGRRRRKEATSGEVFISYAKLDREIAQNLADHLKAKGVDVWWDYELYTGDNFRDVIAVQHDKAKAVVVIWSKISTKSRYVIDEAEMALKRNKLIPTLAPGATHDDVPLGFRSLQTVEVTQRQSVHNSLLRLGVVSASSGSSLEPRLIALSPGLAQCAQELAQLRGKITTHSHRRHINYLIWVCNQEKMVRDEKILAHEALASLVRAYPNMREFADLHHRFMWELDKLPASRVRAHNPFYRDPPTPSQAQAKPPKLP